VKCVLTVALDGEPLLDPTGKPVERAFVVPDDAGDEEIEAEAARVFERTVTWDVREPKERAIPV
jgi:hypothetical protein